MLENQNLMMPAWGQGKRVLNWAKDGSSIYYLLNKQGTVSLNQLDLETKTSKTINTDDFSLLEQPTLAPDGS
ncbi:MAG TPA: hypothetical protein DD636_02295, partial [Anaerolineaceae bacterium]|nr:hypothetical protein [Anaerolineaceae bacterium]